MAVQSIEFVDYIFDRYAYLGLAIDASQEEIGKCIRDQRAKNHPDRLAHAADDLKAKAAENWDDIQACADVLLNEELRPLYNERLAYFRQEKPKHITKSSHTVVIDLEADAIDIDHLVKGSAVDMTRLRREIEAITGYAPTEVDRARKLYARDPQDSDLTAYFRESLYKKISYHEIMDKCLWRAAGIYGKGYTESAQPLMDVDGIGAQAAAQISYVKENVIPSYVEQRSGLLALGVDRNPLLLLTNKEAVSSEAKTVAPEVESQIAAAQSRFAVLSEAIKENADAYAATLKDYLELLPFELLHVGTTDTVDLHFLNDGEDGYDLQSAQTLLSCRFAQGGLSCFDEAKGKSLAEIKGTPLSETTAAMLYDLKLNDPYLFIGFAYKKALRHFGVDVEVVANRSSSEPDSATRPQAAAQPTPAAPKP